jgi:hypothetical protein
MTIEQIPLNEALICINCQTISRLPKRACPHCTGENMALLGKWLEPAPAPPVRSIDHHLRPQAPGGEVHP